MNHSSSFGYPGSTPSRPGAELRDLIAGQTFGTATHPFGSKVINPNDDSSLAGVAMNTIDFETFMVFDFWLTNERI
jgi:hypothetical protein